MDHFNGAKPKLPKNAAVNSASHREHALWNVCLSEIRLCGQWISAVFLLDGSEDHSEAKDDVTDPDGHANKNQTLRIICILSKFAKLRNQCTQEEQVDCKEYAAQHKPHYSISKDSLNQNDECYPHENGIELKWRCVPRQNGHDDKVVFG